MASVWCVSNNHITAINYNLEVEKTENLILGLKLNFFYVVLELNVFYGHWKDKYSIFPVFSGSKISVSIKLKSKVWGTNKRCSVLPLKDLHLKFLVLPGTLYTVCRFLMVYLKHDDLEGDVIMKFIIFPPIVRNGK